MAEAKRGAGELFRAGELNAAIEAANAGVRAAPADLGARTLLAELLLFSGNLERADVVLDAAGEAAPDAAVVVAEFRQLLRAETARRQLRRDGRVPEFLGEPTLVMRHALAAMVALREGDVGAAARELAAGEALRPRVPGRHVGASGEQSFDDMRDADDLCAGFFEVLTTTGKYFWIAAERVARVTLHPPKRPRDLFWRRASMEVADGPDGEVYLPALYGNDQPDLPDPVRLGRETDWREMGIEAEDAAAEGADPLVRGVGQRLFLLGEDAVGIMDLGELVLG